tara:strand:- start:51273 stop:51782 length:510 start_codon:yes stop_codon:yes gene_type:complete
MRHFKITLITVLFSFFYVSAQQYTFNESLVLNLEHSTMYDNLFIKKANLEYESMDIIGDEYLPINSNSTSILDIGYVDTKSISNKINMEYPFKKRRHPMEKTGRILTYIGASLAIIGGIMVASADELYYECVNGNCTGDAKGGFGILMLGAGAGLSGTGTVLWIIGSKK